MVTATYQVRRDSEGRHSPPAVDDGQKELRPAHDPVSRQRWSAVPTTGAHFHSRMLRMRGPASMNPGAARASTGSTPIECRNPTPNA